MTNENQQEVAVDRAEFEAWFRGDYPFCATWLVSFVEGENKYANIDVQRRWGTWQASRAAMPKPNDDAELLRGAYAWVHWFTGALNVPEPDSPKILDLHARLAARLWGQP